ncbi:kinase-like domain-containing protein [Baffinella frigidus]|nr:kinase-like domain-containing protein [Cryptophyta sp. CCMP2293]
MRLAVFEPATPDVSLGRTGEVLLASECIVYTLNEQSVADFGLTQKKQLGAAGTPFWMAPELLAGGGVNSPRTDVYSFGIVLAEVYSGQDPYEGLETEEVLRLVVDKAIRQRPTVDPRMIPGTMSLLMHECWRHEPESRPPFEEIDRRLRAMDTETVRVSRGRFSGLRTPGYDGIHARAAASLSSMSRADPDGISREPSEDSKADDVLNSVFPPSVAKALKEGRKVEPEHHDLVSIFFSDIVGGS